jgi:protease IV
MKSFLKYTLATIVGFFIVMLISILILGGVVSAILASADKKEVIIEDHSILQIELNEAIVDRQPNDPLQGLEIPGLPSTKKLGLDNIVASIEKAKDDENIKGIYLKLEEIGAGYSACEEIRNALMDFKDSEKFIYAYSEAYSQKAYYLATTADKIYINPEGMLMFTGIASHASYYKKALEKLGVEIQVIRHGKFKAAVEPFLLDKMSPENREQISCYIGSIWGKVLEGISESRNITTTRLNDIADQNMLYRPAETLLTNNLVDGLMYEDQVFDILREKAGIEKNDKIPFVSLADMKSSTKKAEGKEFTKNKLAVIYASGEIGMESSSSITEENICGPQLAATIREAREDSTIKAIVLRINSPGGSSLASELIWREVKLTTEKKPVVVSMGDLAASGGYYIACAADTIIANPTTLTGSIGVFGLIPNLEGLLSGKIGVNSESVKTNKLSDMPSIYRPMSDEEKMIMQNMVENVYSTFVNHVSEGRGLTYAQVDGIGQGRVWTGENALKIGLVDILGNLNDAIEVAKEMGGLEEYRIVKLPKQAPAFQQIMNDFSSKMKFNILEEELGDAAKYYRTIKNLYGKNGVYARVPFEFELN